MEKKLLPRDFDFNRKQGFTAPFSLLFRENKWKEYINDNLLDNGSNIFDKKNLKTIIKNHYQGKNNSERIFLLLTINKWMKNNQVEI